MIGLEPVSLGGAIFQAGQWVSIPSPGTKGKAILRGLKDGVLAAPRKDIREGLLALERYMKSLPGMQLYCPVNHHFSPGCYAREMSIQRGTVVIGKIHRHAHLNIISKGKIRVVSENGAQVIEAPFSFTSEAGTKRIGYAEEDTVWTTIHVTNETDLDALEKLCIAETYEELGIMDAVAEQRIEGGGL